MDYKEPIKIRKADSNDIAAILGLVSLNIFRKDGSGFLLPLNESSICLLIEKGNFFVALLNGSVRGCASIVEYGGIAELRSLVVNPNYRSLGIGRDLVEHCKAEAQKKGYERLYCLTNPESLGFFHRCGFVDDERPPEKLNKDCINCPLHNSKCREQAMVSIMDD